MTTITRIRELADQLNSLTDTMAEQVKEIEDCGLGIPAEVAVPGAEYTLLYCRFGSKMRVCVGNQGVNNPPVVKPWSDCSRDVKIQSAKSIPALLAEMENLARERIAELNRK